MNPSQNEIRASALAALTELCSCDHPFFNPVRLLVVGGSSSEMAGGMIGHQSSQALGEALAETVLDFAAQQNFDVAFQCCEHLNRALIVERAVAERLGLEIVRVVPQLRAGGSMATAAWHRMKQPVAVESVRADAGLDVGLTLIGMHLRAVAVPIRLTTAKIGHATVTAARTRPKLIGGERAFYGEANVR